MSPDTRRQRRTERLAARLDDEQVRQDRERRVRERELRRQQRDQAKRDAEEKQKAEDEAYKAMLDEEHRHEEREQRRKERAIEREKRREDRRRKQWEEYEKCIERQVEEGVEMNCEVPPFHQPASPHTHLHRPRSLSLEPVVSHTSSEAAWSTGEHDSDLHDYFNAPFMGQNQANKQPEANENDLVPRTDFAKKASLKKPIEETTKTPNSPWMMLAHEPLEEENDINFDVD